MKKVIILKVMIKIGKMDLLIAIKNLKDIIYIMIFMKNVIYLVNHAMKQGMKLIINAQNVK